MDLVALVTLMAHSAGVPSNSSLLRITCPVLGSVSLVALVALKELMALVVLVALVALVSGNF